MSATGLNYVPQYIARGFSWDALLPYYSLQGLPDVVGYILSAVIVDVLRSFAGAGKTVLFSTTTTSLSGSSPALIHIHPARLNAGPAGTASARQPSGPAVEDGLRATVFLARRLACTRLRFPLSAVRLVPSAAACAIQRVRKKKRMRRTTKAPVGAKGRSRGKKMAARGLHGPTRISVYPGLPCYAVRVLRRLSPVCRDATAALRGGNPWTWR